MEKILQKISEILKENQPAALVTVIRASKGSPQKAGAKMIVLGSGEIFETAGGGLAEAKAIKTAHEVMASGEPQTLKINLAEESNTGAVCGGNIEYFIEPLISKTNLIIFGGGHIAKPLAQLTNLLGFSITLIDDRSEWANKDRFPQVDKIFAQNYREILNELPFGANTYCVLITRGHQLDREILFDLIDKEWKYLGMIGSRKKVTSVMEDLSNRGVKKEKLDQVHAPIGIPLGGQTVEEIAISIASELIAIKYGSREKLPYLPRTTEK